MSTATSFVGIRLILVTFFTLLPVALLVVLQVWLCRNGRRLGLILPILSLLLSLLMVFSIAAFSRTTVGASSIENGVVVQEEVHTQHTELTPGALCSIAAIFLVFNVPTVIFGGIWLHYKNKQEFQDSLHRMKIEDLE